MVKKNRSILYISLAIIMIAFIASGFFVSIMLRNNEKASELNKSKLEVSFSSASHIELKNILPLSDELGKKLDNGSVEDKAYGFLKFSVLNKRSKSVKYNIYIMKTETGSKAINDKYIKFYLTNNENIAIKDFNKGRIPTYLDLVSLSSKPAARLIYSGNLGGNEKQEFILRSWVSDFYNMSDEDELFGFDVFVESK